MKEEILIPELRFPEFNGNWDKVNLGDIADVYDGTHQTPKYVNEGIKFVSVENIGDLEASEKYITEEAFEKFKIKPQKDDIFMTRITAGIIGATAIVKNNNPLAYYVSLALLRKKTDINPHYLIQRIDSEYFKHELHKRIIHIAFPKKINLGEINLCKISFPQQLEEQNKIASFLTTNDKRIKLLEEKKAKLEQYKKGVIQQLFHQNIRFKDDGGKDFPDWEEKRLGEIGKTLNGLTGKTKIDFGEGKPYIQYMQVFRNSKIDVSEFDFVNIEDNEKQTQFQYGDVFFTTSSETPNEIGMASVLMDEVEELYLNSFCFGYRPNSLNELVPEFSQYFFRSDIVRREIIKLAQGSTRFNMSKLSLMKFKFFIPQKEEQQKIAEFLMSVDSAIERVQIQIDGSSKFKKGLLQKMFV